MSKFRPRKPRLKDIDYTDIRKAHAIRTAYGMLRNGYTREQALAWLRDRQRKVTDS